jgi:molybdopterin-guanine dinucleotide biosynthesis protein A
MTDRAPQPFAVVVLAGERGDGAAVAAAAGVVRKVLAPIAGVPVIERVLTALDATGRFAMRLLVGPDRAVLDANPLLKAREAAGWRWIAPSSSPARSVAAALAAVGPDRRVLVTTADHALLTGEIVEHFCDRSSASDADVTVGFVGWEDVMRAYPGSRRTGWKFADGRYCSCNLFGFMTPRARQAAEFWQRAEALRKRPWRIVAILGTGLLIRYVTGRLTLERALDALSNATGARIRTIVLPFPQAAVDLDTLDDWELVKRLTDSTRSA